MLFFPINFLIWCRGNLPGMSRHSFQQIFENLHFAMPISQSLNTNSFPVSLSLLPDTIEPCQSRKLSGELDHTIAQFPAPRDEGYLVLRWEDGSGSWSSVVCFRALPVVNKSGEQSAVELHVEEVFDPKGVAICVHVCLCTCAVYCVHTLCHTCMPVYLHMYVPPH